MKMCSKCKLSKKLELFSKCSNAKDGKQRWCKQCASSNRLKAYYADKTSHRDYDKNRCKILRKKIMNYLENNSCVDCGEDDPIVLQFDHQKDKLFNISDGPKRGYSWSKIEEEIDKCEVRCANCHIRKTAKDQKWYT